MAGECLTEVRRSVGALRLADDAATSLLAALERLAAEFEASAPETEIVLDVEKPAQHIPAELRVALFRVVQESLTNIRKHARATKVLVRLRVEGDQVDLTVLDNGVGEQSASDGHQAGFGLVGVRERVELIGGTVQSGPEPEHGAGASPCACRCPLRRADWQMRARTRPLWPRARAASRG